MAERNANGSYSANDGRTFTHEAEADRYDANRAEGDIDGGLGRKSSDGGGGGAATGLNIIVIAALNIFLAIPNIIATIIAYPFVFFFKLWYVGRLLQTIIFSGLIFGVLILALGFGLMPQEVFTELAAPIFIMVGFWYWLFHYDEIKTITAKEFAENLSSFIGVLYFGFFFIGLVVAGILQMFFGPNAANTVFYIIFFLLIVSSIWLYLVKTEDLRKAAARERTHPKLKKTILIVASAYMVLTLGWNFLTASLGFEREEINIDLTEKNKTTWEEPDIAPIDSALNGICNPKYLRITMRAEPHKDAKEIGKIPAGEFFIIKERGKGNPAKYFYKLEYKGKEGYAAVASVEKLKKDRIATANKHTKVYDAPDQSAESNHKPHGSKVILLGENVNDFIKVYAGKEAWIPAGDLNW